MYGSTLAAGSPVYLNKPRALDLMERSNVDGLVLTTAANVLYATNFPGNRVSFDAFAILPRSSQVPAMLGVGHCRGVVNLAVNPTWVKDIVTFEQTQFVNLFPQPGDQHSKLLPTTPAVEGEMRRVLGQARGLPTNDGLQALADCLRELGLHKARLGFDDLELAEVLKDRYLPDLQATGARRLLHQIRFVKTPEEIALLREAARITGESQQEALKAAREGMDVAEMALAFRLGVVRRGGAPAVHGGFLTGSTERAIAARYHHILKRGDVLLCGAVASHAGYFSDFARTFVVGDPTPAQAVAHRILEDAFARLQAMVRPGVKTNVLCEALIDSVARGGGDPDRVGLHCHSMGLEIVEIVHHVREEGFVLEPNVCFDVYLLYRSPEDGQDFGVEQNYIVTESGCEILDTIPRKLFQVS